MSSSCTVYTVHLQSRAARLDGFFSLLEKPELLLHFYKSAVLLQQVAADAQIKIYVDPSP